MTEDPELTPRTPGWGSKLALWLGNAFVLLWLLLALVLGTRGQWQRALAALALALIWGLVALLYRARTQRSQRSRGRHDAGAP